MADEDRDADAGRADLDLRIEDLLGLDHHFHSSLVEPSSRKSPAWGMTLKAICLVKVARLGAVADEDVAALLEQFVHPRLAGAGDRLVGGDDDAPDRRGVVQRLQRHHHLRGRAIGIGDDVALAIAVDRLGIHLGHDQRHVRIHPEIGAVVDHRAARRGGDRRILLRRPPSPPRTRRCPSRRNRNARCCGPSAPCRCRRSR